MSDLWSTLVYDKRENGWTTRIPLPSLADCYIKWSVDPDEIDGPWDDERPEVERRTAPLVVRTSAGARPGAAQQQAFEFLLANETTVGKAVLKHLVEETKETYLEQCLPTPDECSGKTRSLVKKFKTAAGLRELVELTGVSILEDAKDDSAYVVFDFNSALDIEHGFSVLVHRQKPLNWAGSGEDGGGVPTDEGVSIDWDTLLSEVADYLALLKTIKNVKTATAALATLDALHAGYLHACKVRMELQKSPDTKDAIWSTPQGPKLFRSLSAVSDQYLRLGAKDDVVAVLDQKLADWPGWQGCVKIARKHRK